eukprot:TRINITY_DN16797_c1_g4_i1.p1 TRINITY_DN16797_c1_g4~~TRINITY_DN16797_c1_g4_i1.p1  ORF type:complete len:383 (-),score=16.95 TRINITY_DN16797_c1_g4_i1:88-1179(-)
MSDDPESKTPTDEHDCEDVRQNTGYLARLRHLGPQTGWIWLGILTHLVWGLYPVAARYLQVVLGLPGLLTLSASMLLAMVLVQGTTCVGLGGKNGLETGLAYSFLVCGRASSNMISAKYTSALYIGIVTALAPFVVALLSWAALREDRPKYLAPALVLSSLGSILAIIGQSGGESTPLSSSDAIGMAMAVVSIFASGGMRVHMKKSSSTLSGLMLVSWQYMSGIPMGITAGAMLTHDTVQRLEALSLRDILAFLAFVFVMTLFASVAQVAAVRRIGPTMDGSLQPLRLISTICGGRVVLGESVRSNMAWLGLAIILVTSMIFVHLQPRPANALPPGKASTPSSQATVYGRLNSVSKTPDTAAA